MTTATKQQVASKGSKATIEAPTVTLRWPSKGLTTTFQCLTDPVGHGSLWILISDAFEAMNSSHLRELDAARRTGTELEAVEQGRAYKLEIWAKQYARVVARAKALGAVVESA